MAGAVVGDDTFPVLVGAGLVILGTWALAAGLPPVTVEFPRGVVRARMLGAAGALVAYWLAAPWLGYTATRRCRPAGDCSGRFSRNAEPT